MSMHSAERRHRFGLLALVAVAGTGIAFLLVFPLVSCPTCRGLQRELMKSQSPREDGFEVNCPACSDRGVVTYFRSIRAHRPDARTQAMLQSVPIGNDLVWEYLNSAADLSYKADPGYFRGFKTKDALARIRFLQVDSKDYLAVMLESSWTRTSTAVAVGLFALDGSALDYVQMDIDDCFDLKGWFLKQADPDGTLIWFQIDTNGFSTSMMDHIAYDLYFRDGEPKKHRGRLSFPQALSQRGVCRMAVRGDRLILLAP